MAVYITLLFCLFIIISSSCCVCSSNFTEGSSFLPRADHEISVGYDTTTDTILLIGGSKYSNAFVTFKNHTFQDHNFLQQQTYGHSQHFTQMDDELWVISKEVTGFITMNTSPPYNVTIPQMTIPITTDKGHGQCLASVPGYLFVVGGGVWEHPRNDAQIYCFSDNQWLSNVPSLPLNLTHISCVVVNNKLYVIGGSDGNSRHNTIRYLNISNMQQISTQSWKTLSGKLATARMGTRAVVYGTDIYVIGGYDDAGQCTDVNVIDTLTENCTVDSYLPYGAVYAAAIIVDNILYVFGGKTTNGEQTNKYSYKALNLPLPPLNAYLTTTDETTVTIGRDSVKSTGLFNTIIPVYILIVIPSVVAVCVVFDCILCFYCKQIKRENEMKQKHDVEMINVPEKLEEHEEVSDDKEAATHSFIVEKDYSSSESVVKNMELCKQLTNIAPEGERAKAVDKPEAQLLLEKWKLYQYWNTFEELGYDDSVYWAKLIEKPDVLDEIFGGKKGHREKFADYVTEMYKLSNV